MDALKSLSACFDHAGEQELSNDYLRLAAHFNDQESQKILAEKMLLERSIVESAHWNLQLAVHGSHETNRNLRDIFDLALDRLRQFDDLPDGVCHDRVMIDGFSETDYQTVLSDIHNFLNRGIVQTRAHVPTPMK